MKKSICLGILCMSILLIPVGCASNTGSEISSTTTVTTGSATAQKAETVTNSITPIDSSWSLEMADAIITLADGGSKSEGTGVNISRNTVTITSGGTYVISGKLSSGEIIVEAPKSEKVQIVLNGADITGSNNSAIYEKQSDGLTVIVAEGTVNILTDALDFQYSDTTNEEPKATLFAKDDLNVAGGGTLFIKAQNYQGVATKDDLVLESVNLTVDSKGDAIRGRDSLSVLSGTYSITSQADGLQSNNDEDATKGTVQIDGGTFTIVAANDGIQAETTLVVNSGEFQITTGGGFEAIAAIAEGSYKGMKSGGDMVLSNGTFIFNTLDDTIHSNANILVANGSYTIQTGDDGIHADGDLTVNAGTITITDCYEGLEASTMTINDGVIDISSTDDGINLSRGDENSEETRPGVSNDDLWLIINGGTITIKAGSDAIDSNGNATMNGGTVDLTAALLGEGETIDVDGTWTQNGGDLTETGGASPGGFGGGGMPGTGSPGGGGGAPSGMGERPQQ